MPSKNLFPPRPINFTVEGMERDSSGQLLLVGVRGPELGVEEAHLLKQVQPGAFILFGRNIKTPRQLRGLIDALRDLSDIEPVITIDQEGGRVSRLRLLGNEPPNAQQLSDKGDIGLIRRHGEITGWLLRLFGFNLDLCPVLDISLDDDADNSLRDRCYGRTVDEVVRNAGAFNHGLRSAGVASCGKHFPGYSAASVDAHHELPTIERTRAELEAFELAVFRAFASGGGSPDTSGSEATNDRNENSVDSMMVCHAWYPCLDADKTPASLSPRVVQELLREELEFQGLIMTDDLDMGAILNECDLEETLRLTFAAGNDLAMICHRVDRIGDALATIQKLPGRHTERALKNVARFKTRLREPTLFSEDAFRALDDAIWDLRVAVLGEERAKQRSREDGARSPVELY